MASPASASSRWPRDWRDCAGIAYFTTISYSTQSRGCFPSARPLLLNCGNDCGENCSCAPLDERVGDVIFTIAGDQALRADFLTTLVSELSQMDVRVHCVELRCSIDEQEQRLASADRLRFGKLNSVERYCQLNSAGAFPRLKLPPGATFIDTSGMSVEATVTAVEAHITRGA